MTIVVELKAVEALRGAELKQKYQEIVGVTAKSNNRPYLIKKIIEALKARAPEPDPTARPEIPKRTARRSQSADRNAASPRRVATRDSRLPPVGTILEREYDGKNIRVKILEGGFEYRGKTYTSLSAIANEVTGTSWNGFLFFRLIPYAKRTTKAA